MAIISISLAALEYCRFGPILLLTFSHQDHLLRANVLVPVVLRLSDFGLSRLSRTAVSHVVDFVYRGEVVVPGERVAEVCAAAHALGRYTEKIKRC